MHRQTSFKMLLYLTLFVLVVGAFCNDFTGCASNSHLDRPADYYWRNFFGVVPFDAIPGGYSPTGNMTYIAQLPVWTYPGTFIGNIFAGRREAELTVGGRIVEGAYVKILCSPHWETYRWIATNPDDMLTLTQYHWVIGGAQGTNPQLAYVGRAVYEGRLQIGRVFPGTSVQRGLWLFNNNGNEVRVQSFELLVVSK